MNALQFFADHWLICLIALWFMVELVGRCYSRTMRTIRRLRIAHLRRMADVAEIRRSRWSEIAQHGQDNEDRVWCRRNAPRMGKLYRACRVEIARLRGEE